MEYEIPALRRRFDISLAATGKDGSSGFILGNSKKPLHLSGLMLVHYLHFSDFIKLHFFQLFYIVHGVFSSLFLRLNVGGFFSFWTVSSCVRSLLGICFSIKGYSITVADKKSLSEKIFRLKGSMTQF